MANNQEEERLSPEIIEIRNLELRLKILKDNVESCNAVRFMKSIRSIDISSSTEILKLHGIDTLKAMKINRETNEKIKGLIDKFDKKCSCRRKGKLF